VSPNDKPKIDDDEVLRQAKETLEIHLSLEADGYVVTTETLYDILIGVAANRGTIESICAELADAPDPETIRRYINEQVTIEQLPDLQRRINAGLSDNWPTKLRRRGPIEVAIDFMTAPITASRNKKRVCGCAAKLGMEQLAFIVWRRPMPSFTDNA
jgi:hypothetical protein